jgi:hypothetical protein
MYFQQIIIVALTGFQTILKIFTKTLTEDNSGTQ